MSNLLNFIKYYLNKVNLLKVFLEKLINFFSISFITIIDAKLINGLIYIAYDIVLPRRMYYTSKNLSNKGYDLPNIVCKSHLFKRFSLQEQEFISSCNSYNQLTTSLQKEKIYDIIEVVTGKNMRITLYNKNTKKEELTLNINLITLRHVLNKYNSSLETENLIRELSENFYHVTNKKILNSVRN